jgi:hypothetical protein
MGSNDYVFITHWRVPGRIEQVYDVLIDIENYPRWWPQVYLKVESLTPLTKSAGDKVRLLTRGKLPYTIRWQSEIIETNRPTGFTIRATDDFEGCGVWLLQQQGDDVLVAFDWRLRAEKPLLRNLSFLFKPFFKWNHRWAMARGEEGLRREVAQR